MKIPVYILLVLLSLPALSQKKAYNFNAIDDKATRVSFSAPERLSEELSSFCVNDIEKVRSFFVWIAENISYKIPARRSGNKHLTYSFEAEQEDTGALKPLDVRVAEQVLRNKTAFCDGYSRLFKALCDFAGIRAEIITGYARTGWGNQGSFKPNHTWNAVYIDSNWYLMDVTWASGFISLRGGDFVRYFDDYYFLTSPEQFIRDHYPDDIRWTLLDKLPPIREFNRSPYRQQSFNKYAITSFYPTAGIIETLPGDTIRVMIETDAAFYTDRKIAPEPGWEDSTLAKFARNTAVVMPANEIPGNKIIYTYAVPDEIPEWLHIVYNDDFVLRYRISIKKDKTAMNNK